MPLTLYTTTTAASGLIPQPGRAVDTFPSGLVRVTQTYIGLTANAATHRVTLAVGMDMPDADSSPCIDGLKIFPEVQERRREDGMTEYIVSAYGRANTIGKLSKSLNVSTVQVPTYINITNLPAGTNNSTIPVQMNVVVATTAVTRSGVVLASAANSAIPLPSGDTSFTIISTTFDAIIASLKGFYPNAQFTLGSLTGAISVTAELKALNRSGFGSFDETTATLVGTPNVINFVTITGII
jgi:hypothetical protein